MLIPKILGPVFPHILRKIPTEIQFSFYRLPAGRFNVSDRFTLGANLGYGVGLNNVNDGGFYYAPKVQYGVIEPMDIILAYRGVSSGGTNFGNVSIGVEFKFQHNN